MLLPEQIKLLSDSIYFKHDINGNVIGRNHDIDEDMFVAGKSAQGKTGGNVGKHFDAHGIAKGSIEEQLRTLNQILSVKIDTDKMFYTAPWEISDENRAGLGSALGTAGGTAYTSGLFTLVGDYDKHIKHRKDIVFVAVNVPLYNHMELLKKSFPYVQFVRMEDMPQKLTSVYNTHNKNKINLKEIKNVQSER